MAKLTVFEIRTQRDGIWKIDSLFDEIDLAVSEAKRLEQTRRYAAVLVVEETYNEETERTNTRTIFRSGKEEAEPSLQNEQPGERRRRRGPPSPPQKSVVSQVIGKLFLLAVIAAAGLGLIYTLNFIL